MNSWSLRSLALVLVLCLFSGTAPASEVELSRYLSESKQAYQEGAYEAALGLAQQGYDSAKKELGPSHKLTLEAQFNFAEMLMSLGNPDLALPLFQDLLGRLEKQRSALPQLLASTVLALAQTHGAAGRYELASGILRDYLLKESQPQITVQSLLGQILIVQGDLKEAEKILKEALARHQNESQKPEYLETKLRLGQLYAQQGRAKEAIEIFEPLFGEQKKSLGEGQLAPWITLAELAEVRRKAGDLPGAERDLTLALGKLETLVGKADPTYLQYAVYQAQLFQDLGHYAAAQTAFTQIMEAEGKLYGTDHPNYLIDLNNLAGVERLMGLWNASKEHYTKALEIAKALWGEENPQTLAILNNLALLTENQGLFEDAEPLYLKALELSRKVLGREHPTTFSLQNNLAMLYESQGAFPKAMKTYNQALAVALQVYGPDHPTTLSITNNLGYLYLVTGEYPLAQGRFERVYEAWSKTLGAKHQNTLKAKNNLARVYAYQKQFKKAEPLFQEALAAREANLGMDHPDAIRSRIDYAALDLDLNRLPQAKELLYKALDSAKLTLGDKHPYYFEALNLLAKVQEAEGDQKGSLETLQTVFDKRSQFYDRVLWAAGENTRSGYIELNKGELYNLYRLLGKTHTDKGAEMALQASLDRKGLLLKISSAIKKVQNLTRIPELQTVALSLQEKKRNLAKITLAGSEGQDPALFNRNMNKLEEDINELERRLGEKSAPFAKKNVQIPASRLIGAIRNDEALVDYLYYEEPNGSGKMLALVVSSKKGACVGFFSCFKKETRLVDLGPVEPIREAVTFLRTTIQDEYAEPEDLKLAAQEAYNLIYGPIAALVADKKYLYVVPEDALYLLPYDAMVNPEGKYLIQTQGIRVMSSARDLVEEAVPAPSNDLLIMAGPDYFVDGLVAKPSSGRRSALAVNSEGLRSLSFDPLLGAEDEGQTIKGLYHQKSEMFMQKRAEEAVLH